MIKRRAQLLPGRPFAASGRHSWPAATTQGAPRPDCQQRARSPPAADVERQPAKGQAVAVRPIAIT
jgi:hypothetical protein